MHSCDCGKCGKCGKGMKQAFRTSRTSRTSREYASLDGRIMHDTQGNGQWPNGVKR